MESAPRCVIIDAGLGADSGLDLCERLKDSPSLQAAPIIVLTGGGVSSDECLKRGALQVVLKDGRTEQSLNAVLGAVLDQHERSRGVVQAGDLNLDPRERTVTATNGRAVVLAPGLFAAFMRLVSLTPETVADIELYTAFIERRPYDKRDHELSVRGTLRNYVSRLRGELGPVIGARIMRRPAGYAYVPANPVPRL